MESPVSQYATDTCAAGITRKETTGMIITAIVLFALLQILIVSFLLPKKSKHKRTEGHAVITGGSSGIGLEIAKKCALEKQPDGSPAFSRISLIARDKTNLERAQHDVSTAGVRVDIYQADVSSWESVSLAAKEITNPPTILFNVAGMAVAKRFLETPISDFSRLMSVNYLGSVYATRAFLPDMKRGSTIVFTSSAAGQVGLYGFTAYSASKFALKGFAESLAMELDPLGIRVRLAFPMDTNTPGLERENVDKPEETRRISEGGGIYEAKEVAEKMVFEALHRENFQIYFGVEGWMLSTVTAGMCKVENAFDAFCQICFVPLLRYICLFYHAYWRSIVLKCHQEREEET